MNPVRIQLSRRKGFNLQAGSRAINGLPAVVVSRPSKWGNPWHVVPLIRGGFCVMFQGSIITSHASRESAIAYAVAMFRSVTLKSPEIGGVVKQLRGHNLGCWCRAGTPCHADAILEAANAEELPESAAVPA